MKVKLLLFPFAAVVFLSSCGNDSRFEGYTRAKATGLHYKFFVHNENAKQVDTGSGLTFSYKISTYPKDSLIFDSRQGSPDGYQKFALNEFTFKGSFEDGFLMMHQGDSAAFIISADSFFLKSNRQQSLPPGINPGSYLKGVFYMKEVLNREELKKNIEEQRAEYQKKMQEAEAKETVERETYLADNKITAKPTASGLILVEEKKGKGEHPKSGEMVSVHYTGKLLNGTPFDSSIDKGKPLEFPLGQGVVIPGWEEALTLMSKGSRAKVIIPSQIAYGAQGYGPIPPFSTLVFEMELVDIKPMPAQPEMNVPQQHHEGDGHKH